MSWPGERGNDLTASYRTSTSGSNVHVECRLDVARIGLQWHESRPMTQFGGSLPVTHIRESVTLRSAELTTYNSQLERSPFNSSGCMQCSYVHLSPVHVVATELELNWTGWLSQSCPSIGSTCRFGWAGLGLVEIYRRLMSWIGSWVSVQIATRAQQ